MLTERATWDCPVDCTGVNWKAGVAERKPVQFVVDAVTVYKSGAPVLLTVMICVGGVAFPIW